ncbi:MAG: NAD(P)H-dependent oxidoreductase [Bacteroidaceae bacterium]|nr:NAD(P)H-dependent oxidoreductase [Bacteroidaceae bacterium]
MKKLLFMLAALMVISLSACSQKKEEGTKGKTLIAYFSATGTTMEVAKLLADATGGELYRIEPEQPYTEADLDWTNDQSRSSLEMKDKQSRPVITGKLESVADYDVIYLGFPIWWYTAPTIINTFLESYDFTGKTVIPFATSGSSDIQKASDDLKAAYPDIHWLPGKLLNAATPETVENWVKENQQ